MPEVILRQEAIDDLYHLWCKFTQKKMMDFVFWRGLKHKHSRVTVIFSIEVRAQKAHFNGVNLHDKWY